MSKIFQFPHPYFKSRPTWKWFILINVLIGATMSALDVSIVNVAMPTLKTEFNTNMAVIEWVAIAYMLTLTVFLPFFGRLADMFGRSKLYNTGFVVFTIGSLFCGMATSASFIIAARVLQAVGAGLLQANSVALITQAFPGNERGRAIGIQGAVQAIAMAVGPFVGGILIASVGWRAVFYINLPIGIMGTVAALFILPADVKSAVERENRLSRHGALRIRPRGPRACVQQRGEVWLGFHDGRRLLYSRGYPPAPVRAYGTEGEDPLIDLSLFKDWTFTLGNLTGMLSYYVLFTVLFLMPFYFENVLNYSPALAGTLLTPIPLAMAVVAPFAGHISDKHGARLMTTGGMLVAAAACLSLLFLGAQSHLPMLIGELVLGVSYMFLGLEALDEEGLAKYRKRVPLGRNFEALEYARSLGVHIAINLIADPDWDHERFRVVREWCVEQPEIVNISVNTPYPGTESWLTEERRLASRDYRLFDIQHAVLPTKLPLEEFYAELVTTQRAIYGKHIGWKSIVGAAGLATRLLLRGQTNFVKAMTKMNSVYRTDLLLADHQRPVNYEIPLPPEREEKAASGRSLYVHAPRGRAGRAIDAATERFVDETRMGATP